MKIGFAQINSTVGDLSGNFDKIVARLRTACSRGRGFGPYAGTRHLRLSAAGPCLQIAVRSAKSRSPGASARTLGAGPRFWSALSIATRDAANRFITPPPFWNAARPIRKTYKSLLPTYDVFDEDRYFEPAQAIEPLMFVAKEIGVTICEDIWTEHYLPRPLYDIEPVRGLVEQGAETDCQSERLAIQSGQTGHSP